MPRTWRWLGATAVLLAALVPMSAHAVGNSVASSFKSVVVVVTPTGYGSGVAIGDNELVTAAHVVKGVSSVQLRKQDNTTVPATVLWVDTHRDVAILSAPGLNLPAVPIRAGLPAVGDQAYVAGAPMGDYVQLTSGIVSALPIQDGVQRIQTDAPVNPGNSGGPLLDAQGRIDGIIVTKDSGDEGIGWATASTEIQAVVTAARSGRKQPSAAAGGPPAAQQSDSSAWTWAVAGGLVGLLVFLIGAGLILARNNRRKSIVHPTVLPPLDLTNDPGITRKET